MYSATDSSTDMHILHDQLMWKTKQNSSGTHIEGGVSGSNFFNTPRLDRLAVGWKKI